MKNSVATIKDVAKLAGVSPSTVSYALSGKRPISQAVKERVEQAIEDLAFTPNALALNFRKGSSHSIGLVYPLSNILQEVIGISFIGSIAEVITGDYTLSLYTHAEGPEDLLDAFRQHRVDGLILMQIKRQDPRVEALRQTDYPFTLIGRPEHTEGLNYVDYDFEAAAYQSVKYLVDLGHKHIGYMDFRDEDYATGMGYIIYWQQGFLRACQDFNIEIFRQETQANIAEGYQATSKLIKKAPHMTALLAPVGESALGALRALHDHNKRIPEDISLLCLGPPVNTEWTTPRISFMGIPVHEMGRIAADLLLERISGQSQAKQILLPPQMVECESTAPPPRN